ncbi:EnvZ/OmpR regulon moderator MzrA [Pantoea sp. FN060301]|uniref:EnvZ/OmpR regulon moderator MzrA n=1 Tax=Pantoea sp. FN060301 TaxID=3420380 RepID=UPI003D18742A
MLTQRRPSLRLLVALLAGAAALLLVAFLPALFRNETALQIRPSQQGISVPDGFYVYQRLNAKGIHIKSITPDDNSLVIKFDSAEQSKAAEKVLRDMLPYGFDIARLDKTASSERISRISPAKQTLG